MSEVRGGCKQDKQTTKARGLEAKKKMEREEQKAAPSFMANRWWWQQRRGVDAMEERKRERVSKVTKEATQCAEALCATAPPHGCNRCISTDRPSHVAGLLSLNGAAHWPDNSDNKNRMLSHSQRASMIQHHTCTLFAMHVYSAILSLPLSLEDVLFPLSHVLIVAFPASLCIVDQVVPPPTVEQPRRERVCV